MATTAAFVFGQMALGVPLAQIEERSSIQANGICLNRRSLPRRDFCSYFPAVECHLEKSCANVEVTGRHKFTHEHSANPGGRRARVTKKWPRMNTFFWSFLDVKSTTGPAVILGFLFRFSRGHREALHIIFLDSKNRSEFHEKMMKNSAGPGGLKRSGR